MNEVELGKPDPRNPERGNVTAFLLMIADEKGGVNFDTNATNLQAIRDAFVTVFQNCEQVVDAVCEALLIVQFEQDVNLNEELRLAQNN
jgi:hypothetical protein